MTVPNPAVRKPINGRWTRDHRGCHIDKAYHDIHTFRDKLAELVAYDDQATAVSLLIDASPHTGHAVDDAIEALQDVTELGLTWVINGLGDLVLEGEDDS